MAYKQIFFDPTAPDSGANGSYAHPYSRQDLITYAVTGDECDILCPRGLLYGNGASSAGIIYANGLTATGRIRWMPYDTGPEMRPTAFGGHAMKPGDTGWNYLGAGVWKTTFLYTAGTSQSSTSMRLYVGGAGPTGPAQNRSLGTGYNLGTAIARCTISELASVSGDAEVLAAIHSRTGIGSYYRDWMYTIDATNSIGALYVYTGSALKDPPTFYEGIVLVGYNGYVGGTGFGRVAGIRFGGSNNVEINGFDSVFACIGIYMGSGATDGTWGGNSVNDCNAYAFGTNGILMQGTTPARLVSRCAGNDLLIDAKATLAEEWNFRDKGGVMWIAGTQDATVIGAYTNSCTLNRVRSIDGNHGNVYVGASDSSKVGYTSNARIVDVESISPNRLYGYSIASAGLGVGNVARIARFKGGDVPNFIHKTGSGKLVFSDSTFSNGTQPFPTYDQSDGDGDGIGVGTNLIPGIDIFKNTPFGDVEVGAITLNRCTVMNPYGPMIALFEYGVAGSIPAGAFQANDTLFVDLTNLNNTAARTYNPGVLDRAGMSLDLRDGSQPGSIVVSNVYYWTGAEGQPRVSEATNPVPPLVTMAASNRITGTFSEADPMVDELGNLLEVSPLKYVAPLADLAYDVDGRARSNPTSIGAHEYVEPRASRL